jgi:hypothetical protein
MVQTFTGFLIRSSPIWSLTFYDGYVGERCISQPRKLSAARDYVPTPAKDDSPKRRRPIRRDFLEQLPICPIRRGLENLPKKNKLLRRLGIPSTNNLSEDPGPVVGRPAGAGGDLCVAQHAEAIPRTSSHESHPAGQRRRIQPTWPYHSSPPARSSSSLQLSYAANTSQPYQTFRDRSLHPLEGYGSCTTFSMATLRRPRFRHTRSMESSCASATSKLV